MAESPTRNPSAGRAVAGLSRPARALHLAVLAAFVATGRAPARAEVARMARARGIDPGPAMTELTTRDVLAVDRSGEIRAAYPFSPAPTGHVVTWAGGPTAYAMCAIDALGMSAMLGRPVSIASSEPGTGAAITVEVDHDRAVWHPHTAVVFAGATGEDCCPSVDRTCGYIHFFTTADAAEAWAATRSGITGVVLDQEQALACAVAEFGPLLRP